MQYSVYPPVHYDVHLVENKLVLLPSLCHKTKCLHLHLRLFGDVRAINKNKKTKLINTLTVVIYKLYIDIL